MDPSDASVLSVKPQGGSNIKGQALKASSHVLSTSPSQVSKTYHHQVTTDLAGLESVCSGQAPSLGRAKVKGQEVQTPTHQPPLSSQVLCAYEHTPTFTNTHTYSTHTKYTHSLSLSSTTMLMLDIGRQGPELAFCNSGNRF